MDRNKIRPEKVTPQLSDEAWEAIRKELYMRRIHTTGINEVRLFIDHALGAYPRKVEVTKLP